MLLLMPPLLSSGLEGNEVPLPQAGGVGAGGAGAGTWEKCGERGYHPGSGSALINCILQEVSDPTKLCVRGTETPKRHLRRSILRRARLPRVLPDALWSPELCLILLHTTSSPPLPPSPVAQCHDLIRVMGLGCGGLGAMRAATSRGLSAARTTRASAQLRQLASAHAGLQAERPDATQAVGQAQLLYAVASAPNHRLLGHVERPERVPAVLEALRASGATSSRKVGGALGGARCGCHQEMPSQHLGSRQ